MKTELPPTGILPGIIYSHYKSRQVAAEQCVPEHGLTYIQAGSLRVTEAGETRTLAAGSLLFSRKNFLAKFTKLPAENGPFQAITVVFDHALLLAFSQQNSVNCAPPLGVSSAVRHLAASPLLHRFYESLLPYFEEPLPASLMQSKQAEALRLLLAAEPTLQPVLFDFGQPGKMDLEAFMRQNFRFNVGLKQLAFLTGRSLATFKRDFNRTFHTSPARWLYQQRLAEAYYLLQDESKRPSEVYYEVGFESLAHFSHAFKQFFGRPPSSVCAPTPAS